MVQGCGGGSFVTGYCPGDSTIQCCVKAGPSDRISLRDSDCTNPKPNTCNFYSDCLEKEVHCGPSGYPLGYGLKYCNAFTAARPRMSGAGQAWVTATMLCLQNKLVPYATGAEKAASCSALKSAAFATHPSCYVSSGVCKLPPTDWAIIIQTVSLKELFGSLDALKQTLITVSDCAGFYEYLIKQGIIKVVDAVKDAAKDVWHKITSWV